MHAARVSALVCVVRGLLRGGRLSLTALGRSLSGTVAHRHSIKRVDRLLGNKNPHREIPLVYSGLAQLLVGNRTQPVIPVDWTDVGSGRLALVAAIPMGGRALPIYAEVQPMSGHGNRGVHRRFLRVLAQEVIPVGTRPIVVTDAGFNNPWFSEVLELGWDFVGRATGHAHAIEADRPAIERFEPANWRRVFALHCLAKLEAVCLGWWWLARSNPLHIRLVAYKKPFNQANTIGHRRVLSHFTLGLLAARSPPPRPPNQRILTKALGALRNP